MEQPRPAHSSILPYTVVQSLAKLDNIYEVRLFAWVLAKAQSTLKMYNRDLKEINMQYALNMVRCTMPARYVLQDGDTNYRCITKSFTLANKTIDFKKDDWEARLNIIAFPEFIKIRGQKYITFVIHNELWHALLDFTKGWRLVSLPVMMNLQSVYSIILYILVSQQSKPVTYTIMQLRQILGCADKKAYDRGFNFFAKVIDPARKELTAKAPFTFEYTAQKMGSAGAYKQITIIPKMNTVKPEATERDTEVDKQRIRLDNRVTDYVLYNFGLQPHELEKYETLILNIGSVENQIQWLATVKHSAALKRVENPAGYLVNALRRT